MRFGIRQVLLVGAALVTLGGVMAAPAQAVPAADGIVQTIALGGSDTTEDVMDALADGYNQGGTPNPDLDRARNIPVQAEEDDPAFPVVADANCTTPDPRNYVNKNVASPPATSPAPNGSTDGKNALQGNAPFPTDNITTGCIDAARSSSGPSSSDPAQFVYYAFGLDAVSWAHFDGNAPDSLSVAEIRGIYNCTITNWNQVGGANGTIVRYIPQPGSGTRSFWISTVLGGVEPSTSCGAVKEVQEHDGRPVLDADRPNAIAPFSVAQAVAQGNDVVEDKRAGIVIGQQETPAGTQNPISGTEGSYSPNSAVVTEPSVFVGVRRVYNVIDTRLPTSGQTLRFVGTDGTGPGYVCSPAASATITQFGFGLLPLQAGSRCRVESL